MTAINRKYFEWMYHLIFDGGFNKKSYRSLFKRLHETEFIYILDMDSNRAEDGMDLRYRFGYDFDLDRLEIESSLDIRPCSVLEMMTALSIRCEEHIMDDPDIGNRTGEWFWNMICNLGLINMDDQHFDERKVDLILGKFIHRKYKKNGEGGLFKVNNGKDLRNVEIWYQMCWYLSSL